MNGYSINTEVLSPNCSVLVIENPLATARISLFGGHILQYCAKRDGHERLFLSSKAKLDGSKSIRGGVPICWPWFGAHSGQESGMPAHGYARTRQWDVIENQENANGTFLLLQLSDSAGPGFTGTARVQLALSIGEALQIELRTLNTGTQPFPLSAALHSYFAVEDIARTELRSLSGTYSDKTRAWALLDTPTPYRFTEETDRIHLQAAPVVEIHEAQHTTLVESQGHDSIVVWNPWSSGSQSFNDLKPTDYQHFLCVETALTQGFSLAVGQLHTLRQIIH